jgi:hypothetical protein
MHVCMHACMYVYERERDRMSLFPVTFEFVRRNMYVCTYVCGSIRGTACMYVCMHLCMYVCDREDSL